jgi:hypothetical protein
MALADGLHRLWRRYVAAWTAIRATSTGDDSANQGVAHCQWLPLAGRSLPVSSLLLRPASYLGRWVPWRRGPQRSGWAARTWLPDRRWSTCSTRACARPNPHATRMPLPKPASHLTRKPLHSPVRARPSRMRHGRADQVQPSAARALALTAPLGGPSYSDMVGARDRGGDVDGWRTVLAHGVFLIFLAPFHRSHSHATPKKCPARVCSPALQWLRASCAALVLGGGRGALREHGCLIHNLRGSPPRPSQSPGLLNVTLPTRHLR